MPRGFRFWFVYLGLYCFTTQIAGGLILFPNFSFPALGTSWPMRDLAVWLATDVFHVTSPLAYTGTSGDTALHWIETLLLLIVAAVATAIWAWLDRKRTNDPVLHKWFRLFLRFALAGQMFYFGLAKVIPTQFPPPSLVTLVEPIGNLSASDLLWTFIGSSTAYEMFTGWAEVVAGVLLVIPRTTFFGALLALADMIQVFVLNMAYDVGLKQISFHLILISAFLLAPDLPRAIEVLVHDRIPRPSPHTPLFRSARANHRALIVQVAFGVYLLAMFARLNVNYWYAPGGPGGPKSPLYGIWDVDRLSVDGQLRPPAANDYDRRWRRVIFDSPDVVVFQRIDDSFAHYDAALDAESRSLVLRKARSRSWMSTFTFEQKGGEQLLLDGEMDGHTIHLELKRVDIDAFRLLNSRFRWIRPLDPYGG